MEQDILDIGFNVKKAEAEKNQIIAYFNEVLSYENKFTGLQKIFNNPNSNLSDFKKANEEFKKTINENLALSKTYTQQLKEEAKQQAASAQATAANEKAKRELLKTDQETAKTQTSRERATASLLKTQQEQLKIDNADIKITREKIKNETEEQRLAQAQLRTAALRVAESNKALAIDKKEAKAIEELSNDYKQLSLAYADAALKAKNLALQQGNNSAAAKTALANANALGNKLKEVDALTGSFNRNVGNYPKFDAIANSLGSLLKGAGLAIGLSTVTNFLSSSVDEANQAEQATTRFRNALQNIAREDVFDRLSAKAKSFVDTFRYLDNDDVTEVFQQLITYGKLTEKQITDLTPVIVNFAAKSGLSLNESASVIIKALEGNARALKDYGISIKDGSTVTERLGIIMTDLKPKVEGAAEAFQKTSAGIKAIATQDIANLKEEIGNKLLPYLGQFYKAISEIVSGFGIMTTFVNDKIIAPISNALSVSKALFTSGFSGANKRLDEITQESEAIERSIKTQKELAKVRKVVNEVANDAAAKPLKQQKEILESYQKLKEASFKTYNDLASRGEQLSDKGKAAAKELYFQSQAVVALQKTIAQTQDKSILGIGDPGKAAKKEKAHIKSIADAIAELRNELKALQSEQDQGIITFSEADTKRAERYKSTIEEIFKLKASDKSKETAAVNLGLELNPITQRILERQIHELVEKLNSKGEKINLLAPPDPAKFEQEQTKVYEASIQFRQKVAEKDYAQQQDRLLRQFSQGKISRKEYEQDLLNIQEAYAEKTIQLQIDEYTASLKYAFTGVENTQENADKRLEIEKKLAEAQLQLDQRISDSHKKTNDKRREDLVKFLSDAQVIFNQVADVIGGVVNIGVTNQKNALQDLEDQRQKTYQQEVDRIQNSVLSEQDKSDKIKVLEAKRQAQKEEFDRKNREADRRKAAFDKQQAIFNIILEGTIAVVKAAGRSLFEAIAVGVLFAAKLAVLIATPLPKYAKGIKNKAADSFGIAGEAGPEVIKLPGKESFIVEKETIMYMPKGTDITPLSKEGINEIMYRSMARQTAQVINFNNKSDKSEHLLMELINETRKGNSKKSSFQFNFRHDPSWTAYKNKYYS